MAKQRTSALKNNNKRTKISSSSNKIKKNSSPLNSNNVKKNQKLKSKLFKNSKIVTNLNFDESLLQDTIRSTSTNSTLATSQPNKNPSIIEDKEFNTNTGLTLNNNNEEKLIGQGKESLKNLKNLNDEDLKFLDSKKKKSQKFNDDFTKQLELMGDIRI